MTESQRIVAECRADLMAKGWPADAAAKLIKDLCEAGYRLAIDDIRKHQARNEALIQKAVAN